MWSQLYGFDIAALWGRNLANSNYFILHTSKPHTCFLSLPRCPDLSGLCRDLVQWQRSPRSQQIQPHEALQTEIKLILLFFLSFFCTVTNIYLLNLKCQSCDIHTKSNVCMQILKKDFF